MTVPDSHAGDPADDEGEKRRWMLGSIGLNALLALAKLGWGLFSGSTVVLADAIHSLSDVLGAVLVYAAVRLAPHQSRRFPLGLHKLEDMAAVIAGLVVLFAGYEILRSVFVDGGVSAPGNPLATLVFMAAILVVQFAFYWRERRAAQRLASPGLNSDVINWLGDIGAGLVVMVGIGGHWLGIPYAQEVAVVIIAGLIFQGAYEVLRDGLLSLLDASTAQAEEEQVRRYLERVPAVQAVRDLHIRRGGSALFLRATLELDAQGFEQAHRLVDDLAAQLRQQIPRLENVVLHYEPAHKAFRRHADLLDADRRTPAPAFGRAAGVRLRDVDGQGRVLAETWFDNPFRDAPHGKALRLAAWLIRNRVDVVHFQPREGDPEALRDLLTAAGIAIEAPAADPAASPNPGHDLGPS